MDVMVVQVQWQGWERWFGAGQNCQESFDSRVRHVRRLSLTHLTYVEGFLMAVLSNLATWM